MEYGCHIGGKESVPVLLGELKEWLDQTDARVVHEDIDRAGVVRVAVSGQRTSHSITVTGINLAVSEATPGLFGITV